MAAAATLGGSSLPLYFLVWYQLGSAQGLLSVNQVQSYVGIKEYGRVPRRHSSFFIGLYGESWVRFMESCWMLVTELIRLNRNKIEYYLRGQRAMKHILSAF